MPGKILIFPSARNDHIFRNIHVLKIPYGAHACPALQNMHATGMFYTSLPGGLWFPCNNENFNRISIELRQNFNRISIEFRQNFDRISLEFRQNFDRISIEFRQNFVRISIGFRQIFGRISLDFQQNCDRISIEFRQNFNQ